MKNLHCEFIFCGMSDGGGERPGQLRALDAGGGVSVRPRVVLGFLHPGPLRI